MATALDLIKGALDLINVTGDGMTPSNEMASRGFAMLNDIIKTANNQRLMLYCTQDITGTLVAGQNPHTIGTGGNINVARPVRIERGFCRYTGTNPVDFPMEQIDHNRYQEIIVKNAGTSYPTHFYYKPEFPLGYIYTYPVQSGANIEIHLSVWKQLSEITSLTSQVSLPYGYDVYLKYQLAVDISPAYGKALGRGDNVFERAAELKRDIKRVNQPDNNVLLDFALMSNNNRGHRFNILRGF